MGVMRPVREALDAAGLKHVPLGIDEGRILAAPGGSVSLSGARAVGSSYMAAFDALMFLKMLDTRVSWYSRWAVNTNGQSIGSSSDALDSASTQAARLVHKMGGSERVVVTKTGQVECQGCVKASYPGPHPGPQMGNESIVDVVVGADKSSGVARILLFHFSGAMNATMTANVSVELCGLHAFSPRSDNASATTWIVDKDHSTYWSQWEHDVGAHGQVSSYDETAPALVRGHPGWEWVDTEWPKYKKLATLAPNLTDMPVAVSNLGCTTLNVSMAAHSVILYELSWVPPTDLHYYI